MQYIKYILIISPIILSGCFSIGPSYQPPSVAIPLEYKEEGIWKESTPRDDIPKGEWWQIFEDDRLNHFQETLLEHNLDLQASLARVNHARAAIGVSRSDQLPKLSASFQTQRIAETGSGRFFQSRRIDNTFSLPLDLSYEIDLWGRLARQQESSQAAYEASLGDYYATLLSLQAELARVYFDLQSIDTQRHIMDQIDDLMAEKLSLTQNRLDIGEDSQVEVNRVKNALVDIEIDQIELTNQRGQLINALAILLGEPASGFNIDSQVWFAVVPMVPSGLPSSLLERRPDIAAAERRMASANAQIGFVQAARFPAISLTSSIGYESIELDDLFLWNSRAWSAGALTNIPIFSGGKDKARIEQTKASYEEQVALYRKQVLVAFSEVEDSLLAIRTLDEKLMALEESLAAAENTVNSFQIRYESGLASYVDVIDVKIEYLILERRETQINEQQFAATIMLIKALGGHWE